MFIRLEKEVKITLKRMKVYRRHFRCVYLSLLNLINGVKELVPVIERQANERLVC